MVVMTSYVVRVFGRLREENNRSPSTSSSRCAQPDLLRMTIGAGSCLLEVVDLGQQLRGFVFKQRALQH